MFKGGITFNFKEKLEIKSFIKKNKIETLLACLWLLSTFHGLHPYGQHAGILGPEEAGTLCVPSMSLNLKNSDNNKY